VSNRSLARVLGALAFLWALPAFANSVSAACSLTTTTVSSATPTIAASLICPQFNPALGALFDYSLIVPPNFVPVTPLATFTLQNNSASQPSDQFLFAFDIAAFGTLPGGAAVDLRYVIGARGPVDLPPGATKSFTANPDFLGDLGPHPPVLAFSLSSYIGTGNLNIPISVQSRDLATRNRDPLIVLNDYSVTIVSPNIRIAYDFTPIPEPANFTLTAVGLVLLAWRIRNRRLKPLPSN